MGNTTAEPLDPPIDDGMHVLYLNAVDLAGAVTTQPFTVTVPEPATLTLLGLLTLGAFRRRRPRRKK